ncbi:glycosyltransferase [Flaviramulus aquimarinus]|uniref:Glycosyltransferase n=1 Tax=Flaviramulus aquimarinus TaxID=1170456 RepID=A0ABP9FBZ0_9FLAO
MKDKISIIVPVYNVEAYLERCIDSIINQTYKNLEIILVNDGSTDNSKIICEQYVKKDPRIVVVNQENSGSSIARNTGLDIATGQIISFIDSDDYIDNSMLEKMVQHMIANNLEVVEIEPNVLTRNKVFDNKFTIEDNISAIKRIITNTSFSVWRRIYKKSLIENMRFIPKIIHQDVFFTIDILNKISNIGYLNSPLYTYNTDNISVIRSKYTTKKIDTGIRATEYIIKNVPVNPLLNETVNNYVVYYYTDHYFLLSRNRGVDAKQYYRKKLKQTIINTVSIKNISFRIIIVIILPIKVTEFLYSAYQFITKIKK